MYALESALERLTELVGDEPEAISCPMGSSPEVHVVQLAIILISKAECRELLAKVMESAFQIRVHAYDVIARLYAGVDIKDIGVWQLATLLKKAATAANHYAPYD